MRWLLDYASQQAGGYAIWGRDTDHIEKGFVFGGMPARNGVTAALLVRSGWNGVDDVFRATTISSGVNAPKGDPAVLVDELGDRYEIVNTDIKKWTVGTPIQAPLDAIDNIRRKRPFDADDVKGVVVRLAPSVGSVVDNRDIPDICLQHMVAVMLIDKTASFHAAHDKARMQDATVLRQRSKVSYVPDPALTKLLPARGGCRDHAQRRHAAVRSRRSCARDRAQSDAARRGRRQGKRSDRSVIGSATTQKLIDAVLALETLKEIRTLRPLLQRA